MRPVVVLLLLVPAFASAYVLPLATDSGFRIRISRTPMNRLYHRISNNVQSKRVQGKTTLGMQLGREVSDKGLAGYSGVVRRS